MCVCSSMQCGVMSCNGQYVLSGHRSHLTLTSLAPPHAVVWHAPDQITAMGNVLSELFYLCFVFCVLCFVFMVHIFGSEVEHLLSSHKISHHIRYHIISYVISHQISYHIRYHITSDIISHKISYHIIHHITSQDCCLLCDAAMCAGDPSRVVVGTQSGLVCFLHSLAL